MGLIGPNGSGKTTFFNLITGLIRPDEGQILFGGQHLESLPVHRITQAGVGRTFQLPRLFEHLTVLENLLVGVRRPRFRDLVTDAVGSTEAERAMHEIERVGMLGYEHVPAANLSFGQKKLIEFAGVLMGEPDLILLDEPCAGVAPSIIERIAALAVELKDAGRSITLVEHNTRVVMNICDPVIVFNRGTVLASGTPQEIKSSAAVYEAYLGT